MNEETAPVNWHAMDPEEVFQRLDSGEDGLDGAKAKQRLENTGPNSLEAEDDVSMWRLLARQVHNPLIYLLVGAAVLSAFIGHIMDAAVIAVVVVLNTLLGFFQEWRAEGALNALRKMTANHARVLRDGKRVEIEASGLAPGDVLVLETGVSTADMFCYHARKCLGSLAAALGGLDMLVFTGGIGERAAFVRSTVCEGLGHLGIELDCARNVGDSEEISTSGSRCQVLVIPANEELMIARHALRFLPLSRKSP